MAEAAATEKIRPIKKDKTETHLFTKTPRKNKETQPGVKKDEPIGPSCLSDTLHSIGKALYIFPALFVGFFTSISAGFEHGTTKALKVYKNYVAGMEKDTHGV